MKQTKLPRSKNYLGLLPMIIGIILIVSMKHLHSKKTIGKDTTDNVIINMVVPVLFAYGVYHEEENYKDKAILWPEEMSVGVNSKTNGFTTFNFPHTSAFTRKASLN